MTAQNDQKNKTSTPPNLISSHHGKESEVISVKPEILEDLSKEIEISKEVKDVGVEKIQGSIELPPDIKKLGVTHLGSHVPVSVPAVTITLPISDNNIVSAANAPLTSAIKWLSVWCQKRLKSVHLVLKNIHGKIVRVSSN